LLGEDGEPRLDVLRGLADDSRDRRRGEGCPGDTCRFQKALVLGPELVQQLLDDLAQALRDRTPNRPDGLGDVPSRRLAQEPLANHLVDDGHQKQGMTAGALMQLMGQRFRERLRPQPLTPIGPTSASDRESSDSSAAC
jgi:hypothetical protein